MPTKAKRQKKRQKMDGTMVEVEVLNSEEQQKLTYEELQRRAKPISQGGTRPDGMTRESWRTSQGSFYDDDRC